MEDWVVDDDDEGFLFAPKSTAAHTLVLVGRTGNGKSATGNSILGSNLFPSRCSGKSVTTTCQAQSVIRPDGRSVTVIDTPGMFDVSDSDCSKEIVKCIELAKCGIHALLVVFSIRNRFSEEEVAAVESLQHMFGPKVLDYMVVVFTCGDELDDMSLDHYLTHEAPTFLKEFVVRCGNRTSVIDNKTRDKRKLERQVNHLLTIVEDMVAANSRIPYTNEHFEEFQKLEPLSNELEARILELEQRVGQKVDESVLNDLKQKLADKERRFEETIREEREKRREDVDKAIKEERERLTQELRKQMEREFQEKYNKWPYNWSCAIM